MVRNNRFKKLVDMARCGQPGAMDELIRTYSGEFMQAIRHRMGKKLKARLDTADTVEDVVRKALVR